MLLIGLGGSVPETSWLFGLCVFVCGSCGSDPGNVVLCVFGFGSWGSDPEKGRGLNEPGALYGAETSNGSGLSYTPPCLRSNTNSYTERVGVHDRTELYKVLPEFKSHGHNL